MFAVPAAFLPTFQPEALLTLEQNDCYKARAKALRSRFPWSEALVPVFNHCLIHLSANVPGKVAYYATVQNMMINRLTRTSAEMFLTRTLNVAPIEIQAAWSVEVLGQTLPEIDFAKTPEDWAHVYEVGPNSCMAGSSQVRQYAHPDNNLALAYHQNKAGEITQRVIVNQARKTYLRIYGTADIGYFVTALNKLGYKQCNDTLEGERIWAGWNQCHVCDKDIVSGPYLDGNFDCFLLDPDRKAGVIGSRGDEFCNDEEPYCGCENEDEHEPF